MRASAEATNAVFLALKGLAALAALAIVGGMIYAATMVVRYWPAIGV